MKITHSGAVPRRPRSARPARGSPRSRASTSSPRRCSRPTSAAGWCRDDENNQAATKDAFESALHRRQAARGRQAHRRRRDQRAAGSAQAARRAGPRVSLLPVAIVLNLPEKLCHERNQAGPIGLRPARGRASSPGLRRSLRSLEREGFRHVFVLDTPEEVEAVDDRAAAAVEQPEARARAVRHHRRRSRLLRRAGDAAREARVRRRGTDRRSLAHPPRAARPSSSAIWSTVGPTRPDVLRLVMSMVEAGAALCVPGNHDMKLMRKLRGKNVQITHGLAESLAQLESEPPEFQAAGGRVPRRAGEPLRPRRRQAGRRPRRDEGGDAGARLGQGPRLRPLRRDHRRDRRVRPASALQLGRRIPGEPMVVYGHTPVPEPDGSTGRSTSTPAASSAASSRRCAIPEREFVSVPATQTYFASAKPFLDRRRRRRP